MSNQEIGAEALNKALLIAASEGNIKKIEELLTKGANLEYATKVEENGIRVGTTPLMRAAQSGKLEAVQFLLTKAGPKANSMANATDLYGYTFLHLAAENGHSKTVQWILSQKFAADLIKETNNMRQTLLFCAVHGNCDLQTVTQIFNAHPTALSAQDRDGRTSFETAAGRASPEVLEFLLKKAEETKVDANIKHYSTQDNLIHKMVAWKFQWHPKYALENLRILMRRFPNAMTEKNEDKLTPFFLALQSGNYSAARVMLEQFPDLINSRDREELRRTPLHLVVLNAIKSGGYMEEEVKGRFEEAIELLDYLLPKYPGALERVNRNESAHLEDAQHQTAFELAVTSMTEGGRAKIGAKKLVNYFTSKGAWIETVVEASPPAISALRDQYSPLFSWQQKELPGAIQLVRELGTGVNVRSIEMQGAPLHYAIRNNNMPLVFELLSVGARVDLENSDGKTALQLIEKNPHPFYKTLLNFFTAKQLNTQLETAYKAQTEKSVAAVPRDLKDATESKNQFERKLSKEPRDQKANEERVELKSAEAILDKLREVTPKAYEVTKYMDQGIDQEEVFTKEQQVEVRATLAKMMAPVDANGELLPIKGEAAVAAYTALSKVDKNNEFYREAHRRMYYLLAEPVVLLRVDKDKEPVPLARASAFGESNLNAMSKPEKKADGKFQNEAASMTLEKKPASEIEITGLDEEEPQEKLGLEQQVKPVAKKSSRDDIEKETLQNKIVHLFIYDSKSKELINHIAEFVFGPTAGLTKTKEAKKIYEDILQAEIDANPRIAIKILNFYADKENQKLLSENISLKAENKQLEEQMSQIKEQNSLLKEKLAKLEAQMATLTQSSTLQFTREKATPTTPDTPTKQAPKGGKSIP